MTINVRGSGGGIRVLGDRSVRGFTSRTITPPTPFAPSDLTGLKAWFDATTINQANGSTVSSWIDSSGTGNTVTAINGTTTFNTTALNGHPSVIFSTSDLEQLYTTSLPTGSAACTVYTVGYASTTATQQEMWGWGSNFGGNGGRLAVWSNFGTIMMEALNISTTGVVWPANTPFLLSYSYVAGSTIGSNDQRMDGVAYSGGYSTVLANSSWALTLGRIPGYAGYWWSGGISEILIYNTTHDLATIQQIEAYLASKWSITI